MFLVSSNPNNYDDNFQTSVSYAPTKAEADALAKEKATRYGRGYIFKLEKFLVPTGDVPTQAYSLNDKGEVLPCD